MYRHCVTGIFTGTQAKAVFELWETLPTNFFFSVFSIKSSSAGKAKEITAAKLTFQSGKLTAEFPEEPSDSEVPWKRFMIPQPRFARQHFFNSILP